MKKILIVLFLFPFFVNAQIKSFKSISSPLLETDIYGFCEGENGDIYFFDSHNNVFLARNDSIIKLNFSCTFCVIQDIAYEGQDSILVLSWYGLFRYTNGETSLVNNIEWYNTIAVDTDGTIYIGSSSTGSSNSGMGVSKDKGKTFTFTKAPRPGFPSHLIYDIAIDNSGAIWFATYDGVVRLKSGTYKRFVDSYLSDTYYRIDISNDDVVWATSAYGGLARIKNDVLKNFRQYFNPFFDADRVAVDSRGYAWTTKSFAELFRISETDSLMFPMSRFDRDRSIFRGLLIDSRDRIWISLAYDERPLVIELDYTSSVRDQEENGISIAPNPTSGLIHISSGKYPVDMVEVYDIRGQRMLSEAPANATVDLSSLPTGLYIIKIYAGLDVAVRKVVVER